MALVIAQNRRTMEEEISFKRVRILTNDSQSATAIPTPITFHKYVSSSWVDVRSLYVIK